MPKFTQWLSAKLGLHSVPGSWRAISVGLDKAGIPCERCCLMLFQVAMFFSFCLHLVTYLFFTETVIREPLRKLDRPHKAHHFLFIPFTRWKINHPTYPFRAFLEMNCLNCSFELPGQLWNSRQPHGSALSEHTCTTLAFEHIDSSKQTEM